MSDEFDERTPTRGPMPSVTTEIRGNGNGHDLREERKPEHETPIERIDRNLLELHGMLHQLAVDGERTDTSVSAVRTDIELIRGEQQALGRAHETMRGDLRSIAKAVHAKRTWSGEVALSLPPSATGKPTDTGAHIVVDAAKQSAYEAQFEEIRRQLEALEAEREDLAHERVLDVARREGAEALRKEQDLAKAKEDAAKEARNKRVQLWLAILGAVGTILSGSLAELRHAHDAPTTQAPTTQGHP